MPTVISTRVKPFFVDGLGKVQSSFLFRVGIGARDGDYLQIGIVVPLAGRSQQGAFIALNSNGRYIVQGQGGDLSFGILNVDGYILQASVDGCPAGDGNRAVLAAAIYI